jgi:hypothetical protein
MIDINKPVEKGHDFVLNNDDGTQELGTAEEFAKRREAGTLSGVHTDKLVAAHNEVERVAEPADEPQESKKPKKAKAKESEAMSEDKTKLGDEQDTKGTEERTEGEVKQTEEMRKDADSKPEEEGSDKKDESKVN